jgi:hypothetical protein
VNAQQVHWQYGGAMNIPFGFLFANALLFQPTNNAKQQNKQLAFVFLISSGTGRRNTEYRHIAKP